MLIDEMLSLPSALRKVLIGLMFFYPLASAEDACQLTQRYRTPRIVHEQHVSINTDVPTNTIFFAIPQAAITVTNAPTSFDTMTTIRWTEPIIPISSTKSSVMATTASQRYTSATSPARVEESSFVLMVSYKSDIQKRQLGSIYIAADGTISNDCTTSPIYAITAGVLTAIVKGVSYTYSTSLGVAYAPFNPSTIPGPITTSFTLAAGGALTWFNPAFFNGQAQFCALVNGTVYAVFQQNAQPEGCLYISLSLFSSSSCQGLSLSTVTGPTGPTGPTGIAGPTGPQGVQGVQGSVGASGAQGIQGSQGATGSPGIQGIQGVQGTVGPSGVQGIQGVQGVQGPTGIQGNVGPSGVQGVQGIQGATGSPGIQGSIGPQGSSGATGPQGVPGPSGPSGAMGNPGATGATGIGTGTVGPTGPTGPAGSVGSIGSTGVTGPAGTQGPSGPSGPSGPTGTPGITFGLRGCYVHTGNRASTTGLALASFQATYTTTVADLCKSRCALGGFIFMGLVNVAATADCWCGNAIAIVTSQSGLLGLGTVSGSGAGDNNCYPCIGAGVAGAPTGQCGNSTLTTMAIYARGF